MRGLARGVRAVASRAGTAAGSGACRWRRRCCAGRPRPVSSCVRRRLPVATGRWENHGTTLPITAVPGAMGDCRRMRVASIATWNRLRRDWPRGRCCSAGGSSAPANLRVPGLFVILSGGLPGVRRRSGFASSRDHGAAARPVIVQAVVPPASFVIVEQAVQLGAVVEVVVGKLDAGSIGGDQIRIGSARNGCLHVVAGAMWFCSGTRGLFCSNRRHQPTMWLVLCDGFSLRPWHRDAPLCLRRTERRYAARTAQC